MLATDHEKGQSLRGVNLRMGLLRNPRLAVWIGAAEPAAKFNPDAGWYNGLSPPLRRVCEGDSHISRRPAATGPEAACVQIVYQRCCSMDVRKNDVTACLLPIDDDESITPSSVRLAR